MGLDRRPDRLRVVRAIVGPVLDGYGMSLLKQGYSAERAREHFRAAPRLVRRLQQRGVRALTSLTRARLRACAPGDSQEDPELTVLVRQLTRYCETELSLYPPSALTRIEERVATYRTYLQEVRGFAPSTVTHHDRTASDFLANIGYETHPTRLAALDRRDLDAFLCAVGPRQSRASLQHVVGHLRAFLRFLVSAGEIPTGIDTQIVNGHQKPRQSEQMVDHNILGVWSGASSDKGKSGRRARSRRQGREPRESGGGAQRRALTPASTRGTCRSDDAPATTTSCGRHESRIRRFLAVANSRSTRRACIAASSSRARCPGTRFGRSCARSVARLRWDAATTRSSSSSRPTACARARYVTLTIDDVEWRAGRLRIPQRKTRGSLWLPLTDEVGTALLDYLRYGRPALNVRRQRVPFRGGPARSYRELFLRCRTPTGVLKPTAVTEAFQAWSKRSGLAIPYQGRTRSSSGRVPRASRTASRIASMPPSRTRACRCASRGGRPARRFFSASISRWKRNSISVSASSRRRRSSCRSRAASLRSGLTPCLPPRSATRSRRSRCAPKPPARGRAARGPRRSARSSAHGGCSR